MKLSVYVIHSNLVELRRNNVNSLELALKNSKLFDEIKVNFVSDAEPESLSVDLQKQFTDLTPIPEDQGAPAYFNPLIAPLNVRQVSCALKHVMALKAIAGSLSQDDEEYHMVIEDDVVYGDRMSTMLADLLKALPDGHDLVFLGLPAPKGSEDNGTGTLTCSFPAVYNVAPVCDSYIVSKKGAAALAAKMLPLKFPCNVQMSLAIHLLKLSAHFSRPNIFIDGSKLGVFVSVIETNNQLILNADYFTAKALVDRPDDGEAYTAEEIETLKRLFDSMRFKQHPDIVYLLARLELRLKNYARANELFAACFSAYQNNNCILNNQSVFMKSYIDMCKEVAQTD
jgi:GR25 family glycosyltransferase involved in LPS biosynthesis